MTGARGHTEGRQRGRHTERNTQKGQGGGEGGGRRIGAGRRIRAEGGGERAYGFGGFACSEVDGASAPWRFIHEGAEVSDVGLAVERSTGEDMRVSVASSSDRSGLEEGAAVMLSALGDGPTSGVCTNSDIWGRPANAAKLIPEELSAESWSCPEPTEARSKESSSVSGSKSTETLNPGMYVTDEGMDTEVPPEAAERAEGRAEGGGAGREKAPDQMASTRGGELCVGGSEPNADGRGANGGRLDSADMSDEYEPDDALDWERNRDIESTSRRREAEGSSGVMAGEKLSRPLPTLGCGGCGGPWYIICCDVSYSSPDGKRCLSS